MHTPKISKHWHYYLYFLITLTVTSVVSVAFEDTHLLHKQSDGKAGLTISISWELPVQRFSSILVKSSTCLHWAEEWPIYLSSDPTENQDANISDTWLIGVCCPGQILTHPSNTKLLESPYAAEVIYLPSRKPKAPNAEPGHRDRRILFWFQPW